MSFKCQHLARYLGEDELTCQRFPIEHVSTNKFCQNIELVGIHVSDSLNYPARNHVDCGNNSSQDDCPDWQSSAVYMNHDHRDHDHDRSDNSIPVPRRAGIEPHQSSVDIQLRSSCKGLSDLLPMPEVDVHWNSRERSERNSIDECKCGREETRRVRLILFEIERAVGIHNAGDIVDLSSIVVQISGTDREVCQVPSI